MGLIAGIWLWIWYTLHWKRKQQLPFYKELRAEGGEDRARCSEDGNRLLAFCCGGWS